MTLNERLEYLERFISNTSIERLRDLESKESKTWLELFGGY